MSVQYPSSACVCNNVVLQYLNMQEKFDMTPWYTFLCEELNVASSLANVVSERVKIVSFGDF